MWHVAYFFKGADLMCICFYFFFFKQKTAYEIKECDWSSDVCSSDLDLKTKIKLYGYALDWSNPNICGKPSVNPLLILRDMVATSVMCISIYSN